MASLIAVVFLCFLLSGATGLIYQVIWLRMLGLVFGHTVYAITTVLAAFMGGLALGSFIFARRAGRIRNLLRAYGWLEIGVGIACALVPVLLALAAPVYAGLHGVLGLSYNAFSLVQFALVSALLLVPTTLMGGTLPVLSQALAGQGVALGRTVGALYSVNTFGAVAGVVTAGYLLLPALGASISIALAVAANLAVGVLALVYSRWWPESDAAVLATAPAPSPAAAVAARRRARRQAAPGVAPTAAAAPTPLEAWLTVAALGVSGAVSMTYEVAWSRALSLVIGSSTYAFTAMLVAFLVGIAAGSAAYSWLWGERRPSATVFACLQVGIAAAAAGSLVFFERMPELFLAAFRWSSAPGFIQLVHFVVSAGSLLPFTLLIGATFPCAVAVAARGASRLGRDVGHVYAVNTLGAIVGTVAAGFGLIPTLGMHATIKAGIVTNLALAAGLLAPFWAPALRARRRQVWRWGGAAVAVAAAVAVLRVPAWDTSVMSSGPAIYAKEYVEAASRRSLGEVLRGQRVLYYREGISGTVSVNQAGEHIFLRVNGKIDAGTAVDMPTQYMLGHLPLLLHPAPQQALVIGLGSGITAGAVLRHPVERLDVVEIEPAVIEASRFFARIHGDALRDPRLRVVVADGRNFLLTTRQQYDVIVSEPSNPWIGGVAALFSAEFFQMARQHLRPGGIMVQWLQGYNLLADDLRMVVSTFRTAFPATTIWNTIRGDYLLVGMLDPAPIDLTRLKTRYETNPGVWRDLERLRTAGWAAPLGFFMLAEEDTERLAAGAGVNTDDRLQLEFSAPRALYRDTTDANWKRVRSFRTRELPEVTAESQEALGRAEVRYSIGTGYLSRGVFEDALPHFEHALRIDPAHAPSLRGASASLLNLGEPRRALALARQALAREPRDAAALYLAGLAAQELAAGAEAVAFLERAVALQPQNQEFRAALARATAGAAR